MHMYIERRQQQTHDDVARVFVPADVRAEEDERALVLCVRGVDRPEAFPDEGRSRIVVFGVCGERRAVLKRGRAVRGVVELRVHFPALTLEGHT